MRTYSSDHCDNTQYFFVQGKSTQQNMATTEVIQKLCSEDLKKACSQFSGMFKDRVEALKQTIQNIAILVADGKNDDRPKYLFLLSDILKRSTSKIGSSEVIDLFKNSLPQEGHRVVKRARRMALAFCYVSIVKAGYTKKNTNLLGQIIQELFDMSQENVWMKLSIYKILVDIIETDIQNEDEFLDSYVSIFDKIKEETPSSVDNFYFWLRLSLLFPKLEVSDFYKDPLSDQSFEKHLELLKKTNQTKPAIHPIWNLFAQIDAINLLSIVDEIWVKKGQNRNLVSFACSAAVPYLALPELIVYIENTELFEFSLSTKANKTLINVLGKRIIPIIEAADENSIKIIRALLQIPRNHSFVNEAITKGCSSFNDKQTRFLIEKISDLPFQSIYSILWVQRHRLSIHDNTIIKDLFNIAASKASSFSEKVELSQFISKNIQRITSDGHTWFSLISEHELPSSELCSSLENLIQSTNDIIDGVNHISDQMSITPIFNHCDVTIDSFLSFISQLNKSKFHHWHNISKILIQKAIPLLGPEQINLFTKNPNLLSLAVKDPRLVEVALPYYIDKANEFVSSQASTNSQDNESPEKISNQENVKFDFPISPEAAMRILPNIMSKCTGRSKNNLQEKIALWLFGMIREESAINIIKDHMKKIFDDEKGTIGGEKLISQLIHRSPTIGYEVITYITEIGPNFNRASAIRKMEQWIDDCCGSNEIPVEEIAKSIYCVLDHEYQSTASGRKKAENALVWAEKLIKKIQRNIPRDIFSPLCEKFINTGSRNAATIIRQISNSE